MIGVSSIHTTHFNHFLLIRTSIDSQCLNRYKVTKFQRHLVDAEDKKAIYSTIRHFIPRGALPIFNARLKITSLSHIPTNDSQTVSYRTYGGRFSGMIKGMFKIMKETLLTKFPFAHIFQYLSLLFINKSPTFASIK